MEKLEHPTLFDGSGEIRTPTIYGSWLSGCGREYLFANFGRTQADALTFCCSIGMTLVRFETEAERQCVQKINVWFVFDYLTWSNGVKGGSWKWCPDIPISADVLHWAPGEPNNVFGNENCLLFMLRVGTETSNVSMFADYPCSLAPLFMCERAASTTAAPGKK